MIIKGHITKRSDVFLFSAIILGVGTERVRDVGSTLPQRYSSCGSTVTALAQRPLSAW